MARRWSVLPAPVACLLMLAGCATRPSVEAPAPVAPAPPPAATAGERLIASRAAAVTDPAPRKTSDGFKVPQGYKLVVRDDTEYLCTKTTKLGSRFPQEFCMTRSQYMDILARGELMRQDLRKTIGVCGGGAGAFSCNGMSGGESRGPR